MELGHDLSTSLGYQGEYPLIRPPQGNACEKAGSELSGSWEG